MPDREKDASTEGIGPAQRSDPFVLLIDDDLELCDLMTEFFEGRQVRLEAVHDGRRGLARALSGGHDLILLDVMMPGIDGFEVLRLLRRQNDAPVIMLTARTAPSDRVAGLDSGADDYLAKPFGPEELLARIRAVLRRSRMRPAASRVLESRGVRLVPGAREASLDGASLALTTLEFDILEYLIHAAGRIVTRDELTAAVYRRRASPFDRALDVHVSHLRKKLGDRGDLIQTVRGAGYLFRAEADPASGL